MRKVANENQGRPDKRGSVKKIDSESRSMNLPHFPYTGNKISDETITIVSGVNFSEYSADCSAIRAVMPFFCRPIAQKVNCINI